MEKYKQGFIDFLLEKGAFRVGDFKLKSGRKSPYFINTGVFDDGEAIGKLGYFYAVKIAETFREKDYNLIFGPAYKGIPLSVAASIALAKDFKINKAYAFDRKVPKDHGEGSDFQKNWIVGHPITDDAKIILVDDVLTTGGTKYDTVELISKASKKAKFAGLVIAVDRQEVGTDGKNATIEFTKKTMIAVHSIVKVQEIVDHLSANKKISAQDKQRCENYLKVYGSDSA
jgi:orotate phosphoribosyltransferase